MNLTAKHPNPTIGTTRLACLLAVIISLTAVACGGNADGDLRDDVSISRSANPVDSARSDRLVADLGSADAAIDAIVLAINDGYQTTQLVAAIDSGTLSADGIILDELPAGSAINFLAPRDETDADEGASSQPAGPDISGVRHARVKQNWTLERIRETSRHNAELWGIGNDNNSALQFIVGVAMFQNFTAAEITEMLILGIDEIVRTDGCAGFRIGTEVLFGGTPDEECKIAPGRYPASSFDQIERENERSGDSDRTDPIDEPEPRTEAASETSTEADWAGPLDVGVFYAGQGETSVFGDLESLEVNITIESGLVDVTATRTSWGWQRGGPDPEGRNCGSRLVERLVGSGRLGDPITTERGSGHALRIDLVVDASNAIDRQGTLCELVNWSLVQREPGRPGGSLTGIAGSWGVDATIGDIPVVATG